MSHHVRLSTIQRELERDTKEYQTYVDIDEEVKSDILERTSDTDVTYVSNPLHQKQGCIFLLPLPSPSRMSVYAP
jgi:hypothetical protein